MSLSPPAVLLLGANFHDLFQVVIILAAVIGWVLSQVASAVKKAQQANQQRPVRPPMEQAPEAEAGMPKDAAIPDEIEKFLREAAERRSGKAPVQAETAQQPQAPRRSSGRPTRREGN